MIRKSHERGLTQIEWLHSLHTFSFGHYYDPNFMGFGHLRVINQDVVQPGKGFNRHSHHDMEIISYVIEGELEHQDSLGTGSIIRPSEIQRMSAGKGISHSEFNASQENLVHFLQIWIVPDQAGLPPSYEQKSITKVPNQLILIASPESGESAVKIHQNMDVYAAYLDADARIQHRLRNARVWLQVVKGRLQVGDVVLDAGDGMGISDGQELEILALEQGEVLVFDLV